MNGGYRGSRNEERSASEPERRGPPSKGTRAWWRAPEGKSTVFLEKKDRTSFGGGFVRMPEHTAADTDTVIFSLLLASFPSWRDLK